MTIFISGLTQIERRVRAISAPPVVKSDRKQQVRSSMGVETVHEWKIVGNKLPSYNSIDYKPVIN